MKIRKGNPNIPAINNQKSDKVIIDGLMTAEDLVSLGSQAGMHTIEQLKAMYPHNPDLKAKEEAIISDSALVEKLRIAGKDNDEKINALYSNQKIKQKIKETRDSINKLNKEYKETHENNLIYEKDRKIKELEEALAKANIKTE